MIAMHALKYSDASKFQTTRKQIFISDVIRLETQLSHTGRVFWVCLIFLPFESMNLPAIKLHYIAIDLRDTNVRLHNKGPYRCP